MLSNWKVFIVNFELARQALASKRISELERKVDQALDHLKPLMKAKFLVTYPDYDELYRTFTETFSRYMDQEFRYIEFAAKNYFSKFFADSPECPILDIRCEKKEPEDCGIQVSFDNK